MDKLAWHAIAPVKLVIQQDNQIVCPAKLHKTDNFKLAVVLV